MRLMSIAATAVLCVASATAFAQGNINLAVELPGKTCLGTFAIPHPKGASTDQGAVRISFSAGAATMQTAFGMSAYRAPADAKFGDLEPVVAVQISGNTVSLTRKGSDWKLAALRRDGAAIVLSGEADPRRSNPSWSVATTSLTCQ